MEVFGVAHVLIFHYRSHQKIDDGELMLRRLDPLLQEDTLVEQWNCH